MLGIVNPKKAEGDQFNPAPPSICGFSRNAFYKEKVKP